MTLASQPTTLFHNPWFTAWDSDGAFYSMAFATLLKHYNHIKCYAVELTVSEVEPTPDICALITSFHRFTAHLGGFGRLPSTWTGVWSLISHTCPRHPHFQFQFNNSPILRNSLNFPVLLLTQQEKEHFFGLVFSFCCRCSSPLPIHQCKLEQSNHFTYSGFHQGEPWRQENSPSQPWGDIRDVLCQNLESVT